MTLLAWPRTAIAYTTVEEAKRYFATTTMVMFNIHLDGRFDSQVQTPLDISKNWILEEEASIHKIMILKKNEKAQSNELP